MKRLLEFILIHPVVVLLFFILGTAALGWQARHFEIDASADTLLTKDNELYIQTRVMSERFSPQEFLLIAYDPKNQPVLSQQTFTHLTSLSQELQQLDRVASVRSILNVPMLLLMEGGLTASNPANWTIAQKDFSLEQLQKAFKNHPIYEGLLINKSGTATALQVLFKPNQKLEKINSQITAIQANALQRELTEEEWQRIEVLQKKAEPIEKKLSAQRTQEIKAIRQMVTKYEDNADLYLGGVHVLGYQLIQIIKNDLVVFGSIIAGIICLMLFILFKKVRWIIIPMACCSCSVLLTVGLFGMLGIKTTVISSNFIALQLILTLAIVVHLIVQYREFRGEYPDWEHRQLVRQTLLEKAKPCFYAGLTTAVGFASLLFTGIRPVISFGWMMIIAISFSTVASLFLFPALLSLFPRDETKSRRRLSYATLKLLTHISLRRPKLLVLLASICMAASITGLFWLTVENSFINYFSESTRVHKELTFIDQQFGGSTPLNVLVKIPDKPQDDLVITAKTVQQLQRVQKMLEQQKGMGKVLSIVNFTELAMKMNNGKPLTEYELTAIYRTIDDELREELVGSFYSPENSQVRLSARIKDATEGLSREQLIKDIRAGMASLGIPPENYALTGLFVLYQDILQRLFRSQIIAMGLVYAALALTFLILFRSVKIALIDITPSVLSTITVLGVMGGLGIPLDLMTITITSIAMGIAVDDTIHYTDRYLKLIKNGSGGQVLQQTNFSVGYAMIYTSIIIILGFSMLAFSEFIPSVQFGLLTSLAMALALVWNLSLLPVLLKKFVR